MRHCKAQFHDHTFFDSASLPADNADDVVYGSAKTLNFLSLKSQE
jgi:hypothetical protein